MTSEDRRRRGFWYQVGRPFRAVGRGIARLMEVGELVALLWRPVVWLARALGRVVAAIFDG